MNKTADTLPKFQTDYMFIRTVAESKTQPVFTFIGTRSGVVISFMCAVVLQCDKEMSIIDVCRKVARERNATTVLRFAPRTSHQGKGFVEAVHGHTGTRTMLQTQIETNTAYSFQQFHLPFHLQFVTLDLFSQIHSATRRQNPLSNICLELHMYHLCACW